MGVYVGFSSCHGEVRLLSALSPLFLASVDNYLLLGSHGCVLVALVWGQSYHALVVVLAVPSPVESMSGLDFGMLWAPEAPLLGPRPALVAPGLELL